MASIIKVNIGRQRKKYRLRNMPEYRKKSFRQREVFPCFEFIASIFLFLVALAILAVIVCLLS